MVALDAAGSHLHACELCWLATNGPHALTFCTLYYAVPEPRCLLVMSSERPRHAASLENRVRLLGLCTAIPSRFGEPARQRPHAVTGSPWLIRFVWRLRRSPSMPAIRGQDGCGAIASGAERQRVAKRTPSGSLASMVALASVSWRRESGNARTRNPIAFGGAAVRRPGWGLVRRSVSGARSGTLPRGRLD